MNASTKYKLMIMMFLQFFCWGAWYGQLGKYMFTQLNATGSDVGNAYMAFSIAVIISPFFIGFVADRYFAAQKILGILNLLGAGLLFLLMKVTDPSQIYIYVFFYCLTFAPTLALTSSIAMRQMTNPEKEFPGIRVMGTIAWIAVVNLVGFMAIGDKVDIFMLSIIVSLILGVYAFFLPDTPPTSGDKKTTVADIIGLEAFSLFKDRSFLIFFVSSILICIPLSFYYALANSSLTDTGMQNVENKMSLGQVSEVLFMLLIPVSLNKLGIKKMFLIGLLAWIIRFLCFGYGTASTEWILFLGILLHGVCYDFFFVTGQIYTDSKAGDAIKSQAQSLITLATYGIGMAIGSLLSGKVTDLYTIDKIKDWSSIWLVPTYIAVGVFIFFALVFKAEPGKEKAL
jgi:nucleoside transporter